MKVITLFLLLSLITFRSKAQAVSEISESEYSQACNNKAEFRPDSKLFKIENKVYVRTKNWVKVFKDTLVEEEDAKMKMYEVVGLNDELNKVVIKEVGLVTSNYLLIDLRTKKVDVLTSMPLVSKNLKYLVCISEPESDSYLGLEIFEIRKDKLRSIYKESDPKYMYKADTGKWCGSDFFIQRKHISNKASAFIKIHL